MLAASRQPSVHIFAKRKYIEIYEVNYIERICEAGSYIEFAKQIYRVRSTVKATLSQGDFSFCVAKYIEFRLRNISKRSYIEFAKQIYRVRSTYHGTRILIFAKRKLTEKQQERKNGFCYKRRSIKKI